MQTFFILAQIFISLGLIFLISIQSSSNSLTQSISFYRGNSFSKRGLEKVVVKLTFVLIAMMIVISILQLILK